MKKGFNGQWVEICRVGQAVDSTGVTRNLDRDYLETAIANYNAGNHEAPIVVGHPESDTAPAYGWTEELRLNGEVLEARFKETDDQFEQLVADGRYKKRSASFYLNPPNLRHVGFLGAQPPAIKGLQDIKFADGDRITIETFNLQETKMKTEDLDQMPDGFWEKFKAKLGMTDKKADLGEGGEPAAKTAEFTEASVKELIANAAKAVKDDLTTEFTEKLTAKDAELEALKKTVDAGTTSGRRSEIVSFVESIPAEKGKHFLKRAGVVEFMESLAVADAADSEKAISFSEGDGDNKVDHKLSRLEWAKTLFSSLPTFVQFGEQFGSIKAGSEATLGMVSEDEVNEVREAMGVKTDKDNGGAK